MVSSSPKSAADDHKQEASGSQKDPEHFPFLHLTRELRDLVYIQLLAQGLSLAPPSLSDLPEQENRKKTEDDHYGRIMYAPFPEHISCAPALLLVSKQLHREVKEVLSSSRLTTRPRVYRLDCVISGPVPVRGRLGELYPTWLSVPVPSSNVDVVEANVRFRGDLMEIRLHGDGGPGQMFWNLLTLLNRFLSRGPHFLSEQPKLTGAKIGVLVVNVVKPAGADGVRRYVDEDTPTLFEEMVFGIGRNLMALLRDKHGRMMRERVGVIRLCVDGEEKVVYDVRQRKVEERFWEFLNSW